MPTIVDKHVVLDAFGRYSAGPCYGAFDSEPVTIRPHTETDTAKSRRRLAVILGYNTGDILPRLVSLAKEAQITLPDEKGLASYDWRGAASKLAKAVGGKVTAHIYKRAAGMRAALKTGVKAGAETLGMLGGGAGGILAGELAAEAFDAILKRVGGDPDKTRYFSDAGGASLGRADWVSVYNGMASRRVKIKQDVARHAWWAGGPLNEEEGVDTTRDDFEEEEDWSVGFVVGPSTRTPGFWNVFNFASGHVEEHEPKHVVRVAAPLAVKYSQNVDFEVVRAAFFAKEAERAHLAGKVVMDPGAMVLYEGMQAQILASEGDRVVIQNATGGRYTVDALQLAPGETSHDVVNNYGEGTTLGGSGNFTTEATRRRYAGQWLWMPTSPAIEKSYPAAAGELVNVHSVEGPQLNVYSAFDGDFYKVASDLTDVAEGVPSGKLFTRFQNASVVGIDTEMHSLGPKGYTLDILGVGEQFRPHRDWTELLRKEPQPLERTAEGVVDMGNFGGQSRLAQLNDELSLGINTGQPQGELGRAVVARNEPFVRAPQPESAGTSALVWVGAAVLGYLAFASAM
jgi:hypothetical protein